jgi:hypothetical protein
MIFEHPGFVVGKMCKTRNKNLVSSHCQRGHIFSGEILYNVLLHSPWSNTLKISLNVFFPLRCLRSGRLQASHDGEAVLDGEAVYDGEAADDEVRLHVCREGGGRAGGQGDQAEEGVWAASRLHRDVVVALERVQRDMRKESIQVRQ